MKCSIFAPVDFDQPASAGIISDYVDPEKLKMIIVPLLDHIWSYGLCNRTPNITNINKYLYKVVTNVMLVESIFQISRNQVTIGYSLEICEGTWPG